MKRCPNCNQTFDDSNDFCFDDGTPLLAHSTGYKSSGEMPTQFIPHPQYMQSPTSPAKTSPWVFPLVGILCGLVVVFGFFAFLKKSSPDQAVSQKNTDVGESNSNINTRLSPQVEPTQVPATQTIDTYSYARFPEGSTRLLTNADLYGKSSWDLRIMRNEIFARHGYIFKRPGLRRYFSSQPWYTPRYADVSGFLSITEKQNVEFLKRHE
jgi:hypothetical protein